ncbi:MAG: hypothetical protein Q7J85_13175 [Bacillota bacterium]|nr:hypothetical protein [Bacillota bacterium]
MHRQTWYMVVMSLLLVGIGFFLGQYYAISKGTFWQTNGTFWSTDDHPILYTGSDQEHEFSSILLNSLQFTEEPSDATEELQFPSKVSNLYMDKLVSGKEALDHSYQILGSEAPINRVYIPHYSSEKNQAIVWVYEMNSSPEAHEYLNKINYRMEESETCEQSESFFIENIKVFYVKSLDYDSYYYRKNNFIYWFSFQSDDPIPLFLKFYEQF